jgi:hydrogenase nickel incorporation protein HypA/HybF
MHEVSVMTDIVNTILDEAKKHQFQKIQKVNLEVGELMFLGEDQLRFAYTILTQDNEVFNDSELIIKNIKPKIQCESCGFQGALNHESVGDPKDPSLHLAFPKFSCPKCKGSIKVIEGRECIIRNITGEVKDDD